MSLFKSLLFLHGHIVRPEDAELLARDAAPQSPADLPGPLHWLGGRRLRARRHHGAGDASELPPITREPVPRRPELAGCG
ncbi:hypothetical protein GCM10027084_11830 [Pseudoxanthomonas sangjuensis]|uniref:hypothetical protein n=1 Tax=Pseudoxanthomonas sangjuensis TaxID=1503750 RepID=UPI001391A32A|nr:hypothetical protein [Pseudoxanthomonas sangjuensis]KAF1708488.1 hypothetical protein CSC71_11530 [Pseudoxanthomonas sangjuensis]